MRTVIEYIQDDNPSYNPLDEALVKSGIDEKTWRAACDRIYIDGYYGPVSNSDWKEQDGREPSTVKEAEEIIVKVLDKVDDYYDMEFCEEHETDTTCTGHRIWDSKVDASEIRAALVPFYKEIYGVGYPT